MYLLTLLISCAAVSLWYKEFTSGWHSSIVLSERQKPTIWRRAMGILEDIFGGNDDSDNNTEPSDDWKEGHESGFDSSDFEDGLEAAGNAALRAVYGDDDDAINDRESGRQQGIEDRKK